MQKACDKTQVFKMCAFMKYNKTEEQYLPVYHCVCILSYHTTIGSSTLSARRFL